MTILILTFASGATLFMLAAMVDKRWPDRLSRRGRQLAGMREPRAPIQDRGPVADRRSRNAPPHSNGLSNPERLLPTYGGTR